MAKKQLQEMDVAAGTKQSKTAVNANAKPAMPMDTSVAGSVEDLGGPTPMNYKPDDDSAKLKTPGGTLKQVKDVVNSKAKPAEPMKGGMKEEDEIVDEVIEEEEVTTDEVVAEEESTEEVEVDIEEDVNALFGGEDLSEEFKEKAKLVFETALNAKVSEVKEALEAKYQETLDERIAEEKASLSERVDNYLEYVADEWFTENALAVEQGLKTDMTESFLSGMKSLFEEHYVTIPEDKYDVLESMVEKLDDMETKLNEQIEKNVSLNSRLGESVANGILESVSEGLASTQKEKLASLSQSLEFESEESYREKLETLKESYFPSVKPNYDAVSETIDDVETGNAQSTVDTTDSMAAYMSAIGRSVKK